MWLKLPSTCLASVPEALALISDSELPLEMPAGLSVTLSGKPLLPQRWRRACKMRAWMKRLSGTMLPPSMANRGAELWIASLRASRARMSALPGGVPDSSAATEPVSGTRSPGSFAKWDRNTSSWRTSGGFSGEASRPFSATWPILGMMRNGLCSARPKSARLIGASDSSSSLGWPTPSASEYVSSQNGTNSSRPSGGTPSLERQAAWQTPRVAVGGYTRDGRTGVERASLEGQAEQWPTPMVSDINRGSGTYMRGNETLNGMARNWPTPKEADHRPGLPERNQREHSPRNLNDEVATWGTPRVTTNGGNGSAGRESKSRLEDQVANWPTPTHAMAREPGNAAGRQGAEGLSATAQNWPTPTINPQAPNTSSNMVNGPRSLEEAALLMPATPKWPTPAARDYRTPNSQESQERRNDGSARGQQLQNFVEDMHCRSSLPVPAIAAGPASSKPLRTSRPRLNPEFVGWMMGWPEGWTFSRSVSTASGSLVTALSPSAPPLHGLRSSGDSNEELYRVRCVVQTGGGDGEVLQQGLLPQEQDIGESIEEDCAQASSTGAPDNGSVSAVRHDEEPASTSSRPLSSVGRDRSLPELPREGGHEGWPVGQEREIECPRAGGDRGDPAVGGEGRDAGNPVRDQREPRLQNQAGCSASVFLIWLQRSRGELSRLVSRPEMERDGQMRLFGGAP